MSEIVENNTEGTIQDSWCGHKYQMKYKNKVPLVNCKGCWFKYFHHHPGIVLALSSVSNLLNNLYETDQVSMHEVDDTKRIIKSGMGNKFYKNYMKYLDEIVSKQPNKTSSETISENN